MGKERRGMGVEGCHFGLLFQNWTVGLAASDAVFFRSGLLIAQLADTAPVG